MDPLVLQTLAPVIGIGVVSISAGWVLTTWLRIKNGYPLDGAWGQAVYPKHDGESRQETARLTRENGELREELIMLKDRLANVERIVTDSGYHVGAEIEALRRDAAPLASPARQSEGAAQ
ncbi:MAG: hypothetical protein GC147_11675 [Porphyrobacter sp.]|nr:hypothetical protein [Porphyrobacter sp.]